FDGEQVEVGGEASSIDSPWSRSIEDLHGDAGLPSPSSSRGELPDTPSGGALCQQGSVEYAELNSEPPGIDHFPPEIHQELPVD
ncbi:hypothetical protein KUCAC02_033147, partial [Chaenocephalus aceratus]